MNISAWEIARDGNIVLQAYISLSFVVGREMNIYVNEFEKKRRNLHPQFGKYRISNQNQFLVVAATSSSPSLSASLGSRS